MSTEFQKQRNRLRLISLLIIYPIYKCIDSIFEENWALAIIMGFLSLLYAGVLIYTNYQLHKNKVKFRA